MRLSFIQACFYCGVPKMKFILGAFIWLIALINLTIPLSIVLLVKLFILAIYSGPIGRRFNHNENDVTLHSLDCGDSLVAFDTSWNKPVVNFGFVLETDGNIKVHKVREWFSECFNLGRNTGSCSGGDNSNDYPKLYSYLVKRAGHVFRACSKRSLGNLEENIVKRRLGDYGRNAGESLEEFISRWIVEPYKKDKPCWSIAVIRKTSNCTAIAFKIHHALCDGYSLLHILDKLCGGSSKAPYLVKPYNEGVWASLKQYLEAPFNLGKMGGATPESNPFRVYLPPPPQKTYDWMFSFTTFHLGDMKTIRRKCGGVHMTAIIWTIVGGALRRFLLEEGVEVPEYILVGNTMPVPSHPAMLKDTRSKDRMCNHWVAAILQIPIREPDPILRSQQIETELTAYLTSGLDKLTKSIVLPFLWTLPGSFVENSLGSKDMGIGGGLTSLIGADSYNFMGFRVRSVHPILATHDINPFLPLSCFTFSHGDKMELSLGANPRSLFKNQKTLDRISKRFCHDELEKFIKVTNI